MLKLEEPVYIIIAGDHETKTSGLNSWSRNMRQICAKGRQASRSSDRLSSID